MHGEINESVSKSKSKNKVSPTSSTEKTSTAAVIRSDVHRPTIISTSPSSVPTLTKRNGLSTRSSTSRNNAHEIAKSRTTAGSAKQTNQVHKSFLAFDIQWKWQLDNLMHGFLFLYLIRRF